MNGVAPPAARSERQTRNALAATNPGFSSVRKWTPDTTVSAALAEGWTWPRVDRLVRAILLAGAYELLHRSDVPPRVAINEYVEIAHAFYDQGEPNFINSVLDRVARQARSAELVR